MSITHLLTDKSHRYDSATAAAVANHISAQRFKEALELTLATSYTEGSTTSTKIQAWVNEILRRVE